MGLAQIRVKVGVKRAPGSLAFTVPSSVRLFEGELPVGANKGAAFLGKRTIDSAGEYTFVFYAEGKAPYQEPQQLVTSYDPEGPGEGKAQDIVTVLPVRMGIDVDSDNNGTVSSSDDLIEAKPGEIGMIAPMTADPANGKPGKLRGLFSTNVAYLLDNVQTNPVVRLGRISGTTGHVCVWKVRAGQTPALMLNTSQSSSTTTDGDGHTLFQLLGDAADHDILITGVAPGEVMLGLQLTVNGVKVAMDVVRVTVLAIDLDIDSDNNNGYDPPARTPYEEEIEDISGDPNFPGKIIIVNDNDPTATDDLVPMILQIPEPIDLATATLRLTYNASHLRIWSENEDYIAPGIYTDLSIIGLEGTERETTLFVEGIALSTAVADQQIKVEVDPGGSGSLGFVCEDAVRVTVVRVNLLVDTDRNGHISPSLDQDGKGDWTKTRGAIFSVNCDRDGGRTVGGLPVPDAIHIDDTGTPVQEHFHIHNADDQLDIAPMLIRKVGPIPGGFKVFLRTPQLEDVQRTHIYKKIEAGSSNPAFWGGATATATSGVDASGPSTSVPETRTEIDITRWVDPASTHFQGGGAAGDATFGIEGLMFRWIDTSHAPAPAALKFDGQADFVLELRKDAAVIASSAVRLRVAPWMMLSRDQASEEVWVENADSWNQAFRDDLEVESGGQVKPVARGHRTRTQWFQDHVEIGYTQRPAGPKKHVVLRLPYEINPTWPLFNLLAKDVGVYQLGADLGVDSGDFGGNLEILTPDSAYPLGRIATGSTLSSLLRGFLTSQEVQEPVFNVPVRWLIVGHIDEVTSFLAGGEIAIADAELAWNLISDTSRIPEANRHQAVFFATGVAPQGGTVGGGSSRRLYDGPATGSITVVQPATKATGSITTVSKANLVDGETFTIGDGRSTKTFEFDVAGDGVAPGNVTVDVSGIDTAGAVRDAMLAGINVAAGFAIAAEADGAAGLTLTTSLPGTLGNVAITETVAHADFTVAGMAGGTAGGRDFTTESWGWVRTFSYDAAGEPRQGQVASIASRHDGWIEIERVWNTTSKLVPGSGATAHLYGYSQEAPPYGSGLGVAPNRSWWYHIPDGVGTNPDKYVVVQGTKRWNNGPGWSIGTPAMVTVEEVLADEDFETLNRIDVQGRLNTIKSRLNAARAGLVYRSVPGLFFGVRGPGFHTARSAVAFNPGPTNLQTMNDNLYVATQFGPRHQTTTDMDIFAAAIKDALGAARVRWVDDWEYYHALKGEVHCGTAARHAVLDLDWWSHQP